MKQVEVVLAPRNGEMYSSKDILIGASRHPYINIPSWDSDDINLFSSTENGGLHRPLFSGEEPSVLQGEEEIRASAPEYSLAWGQGNWVWVTGSGNFLACNELEDGRIEILFEGESETLLFIFIGAILSEMNLRVESSMMDVIL